MRNLLRSKMFATCALTVATLLAHSSVAADAPKNQKPKPYPLSTCVVSGEKLGGEMGEPYVFTHEGREIKLCCKSCLKDFNKEPVKFVSKVDAAAKNVKPYPLATCLVSDEKFGGDMGDPYEFIYDGREIKLCCKSCLKDFNQEPAKFLKKLDDAQKNAKNAPKSGSSSRENDYHSH